MSTSSARGRWTAVLIGALLAALSPAALAACSSDDADPPPTADDPTSTTAPTTTVRTSSTAATTKPPTPEQEVEQAYLDITERYYERFAVTKFNDDRLEDDFVGVALENAVATAQDLRSKGQHYRFTDDGPPVPDVEQISVDGETASVISCYVDDVILVDEHNRAANEEVASSRVRSTLQSHLERWRVSRQVVEMRWPDAEGCDR